ncbi:MAG: hypothetical protein JO291_04805 [Acidimicrobiia bacterium]|nr:hypothetical protein [Acidimicrobiia bacterium]
MAGDGGGRIDAELERLLRAAAPLWSAEAELVEAYFSGPTRTQAHDLLWLERQCYKELVDGVEPRLRALHDGLDELGDPDRRAGALVDADELEEELRHLDLFLAAHQAVAGTDATPLDVARLRREGGWPENDALREARARHRRDHGRLGQLAEAATEGGCCTLYAAGMQLPIQNAADELIVAANRTVYVDEVRHMRLDKIGERGLTSADWSVLTDLVAEQLRLRVDMRDAQFSHPLDEERVAELRAGGAAIRVDILERIGLTADQAGRVATSST